MNKKTHKIYNYKDSVKNKFKIDFNKHKPLKPNIVGVEVIDKISLEKLVPFIDWSPFFSSWGLHGKYPDIFDYEKTGSQAKELFNDAQTMLKNILIEKSLTAKAVFGLFPANSNGDDIEVYQDESRKKILAKFVTLRQQLQKREDEPNYSISDFISPKESK